MMTMMVAMMDGDLVFWNLHLGVFNRTGLCPIYDFLFILFFFTFFFKLEFGFGNFLDGRGLIRSDD